MDNYTAIGRAEGFLGCSQSQYIEAWQHLIDTGLAWNLQGYFGRTAATLIESGECRPAADPYGDPALSETIKNVE